MRKRVWNDVASPLPRACRPDNQVMSIILYTKNLASKATEDFALLSEPTVPVRDQRLWHRIEGVI